jgi:putative flippase GtrA
MKKFICFCSAAAEKYPLFWQFFKFCVVGLSNLLIYLSVYLLMTRIFSWHYIFASIIGFVVAVSWSFYFNLKWTFKHCAGNRKKQYVTFFAANIISMVINLALLTFFIEVLKIYDLEAQLLCVIIMAFFNFGLNRFWTFRNS